MASSVDIANLSAVMLGAATITSLSDPSKTARTISAVYDMVRDSELRAHRWKFSIQRTTLPALTSVPASGVYNTQYQLPTDFLKELDVGDSYPGLDLSDYRTQYSNAAYSIENGMILTNLPAPLSFRYIYRITDTSRYDANFVTAFAAMLAWITCETITSSVDKRKLAMREYNRALSAAIRANAIESPPEFAADDTWIMSRLQ